MKGLDFMIYNGNEKYIFVSYAHKDSRKVLPIIDVLSERGFRVWYDAGIEAGTEWPEYIEEHLKNAEVILVFMTPETIESKNCRNEINFALDLNKEILVVYLEETTLLKGMRLQLNSTQSLFRKNHTSNESFMRELINARILRSCRVGAEESVPTAPAEEKSAGETRIANICSIGAKDKNDLWPKGRYSQVINRDEFSVVFFHVKLLKTFGFSGKINTRYQVYNSDNNLIYEEESPMQVEPDYDRISKGWILKGDDGSFVPSGEYRFVCSINNSPSFTYFFSVSSDDEKNKKAAPKKSLLEKIKTLFEN